MWLKPDILEVAVAAQVCFAIWTRVMNIHALWYAAGNEATAKPATKKVC